MSRYLPRNCLVIEREICPGVSIGLGNTSVEIRSGNKIYCE